MAEDKLRIGIIGAGDVAHRHYLPGLESRSDRVVVAAFADPTPGAGEKAAEAIRDWSSGARSYADTAEMLRNESLDGVINLTPAPLHGRVNRAVLEAGVACFTEKPLASTIAEADDLIELAKHQNVLFLGAPGSAVTARVRWLNELAQSGRLGRPTLAVTHEADPGPAAWREYTGDPTPFYREGVGPVFDHGVYRLHEMTTILGPVRRVSAVGSIAIPRRRIRGLLKHGETIDVTTPDHVLILLEFASGALGHLLASFGTPDSLAPWLELHLERGTVSFGGKSWDLDAPVSIYTDDDTDAGLEDWEHNVAVPRDTFGTVALGARHFVACLLEEEKPVLTAEHARHVLDVILKTYESIEDGKSHETETTF